MNLQLFFESWELFQFPALAGVVAGIFLGLLGVYIVSRQMVFVSAALSQTAGFGVAMAFYFQSHHPIAWAILATIAAALLLMSRKSPNRDARLGIVFLVSSAGALAIATRVAAESHDIESILHGSAVVVLRQDFFLLVLTLGILLALHLWWFRGFMQISFDRNGAMVRGLPVRLLEACFLLSVALAISVSTKILGALPVFAFSVLPGMAALRISKNVPRALILAMLIGAISGFSGYLVAFLYELPVGASQTLVASVFVLLAEALARLRVRL